MAGNQAKTVNRESNDEHKEQPHADGGRATDSTLQTRVEGRDADDTFCRLAREVMQCGIGESVQGVIGVNSVAMLVEARVLAGRRYRVVVQSRGDCLAARTVRPDGVGTAEAIAEVVGEAVEVHLTKRFDVSRRTQVETFDFESAE